VKQNAVNAMEDPRITQISREKQKIEELLVNIIVVAAKKANPLPHEIECEVHLRVHTSRGSALLLWWCGFTVTTSECVI